MPLITKHTRRFDHPTVPGEWYDCRLPLTTGDLAGLRMDGKQVGMTIDLMSSVIVAWSHDVPVSLQAVEALDINTYVFLQRAINAESGIEENPAEKKDAPLPLPPASPAPQPEPSFAFPASLPS